MVSPAFIKSNPMHFDYLKKKKKDHVRTGSLYFTETASKVNKQKIRCQCLGGVLRSEFEWNMAYS